MPEDIPFLFWNLNRNTKHIDHAPMEEVLAHIAAEHRVQFILLAEAATLQDDLLLEHLAVHTGRAFRLIAHECPKIKVFADLPDSHTLEWAGGKARYCFLKWTHHKAVFLLVVAHLRDRHATGVKELEKQAEGVSASIRVIEEDLFMGAPPQTLLVGDLNLNPFDPAVTDYAGFNAVPCKTLARNTSRTHQGQEYPYFYNPMWNLLGDAGNVPGTYYHGCPEAGEVHWNILDQVLMRPSILPLFQNAKLSILDKVGTHRFTTEQGLPHKARYSDHLPIVFTLVSEKREVDHVAV